MFLSPGTVLSGGGLQRAQPAISAGDMFYHQDPEVQAIINTKIMKEILDAKAKKVPYDEKKKVLKGIFRKIHPDKVAKEEQEKLHEVYLFFMEWKERHTDWFLGTPPSTAPSAPLYSSFQDEVSAIVQPLLEKIGLFDQLEDYGKEKAQTSADLNDLRGKVAKLEGYVELLLTKADKDYVDAASQESGRKLNEVVVRLEATLRQEKVRVCHELESMRERVGLFRKQAQKWEATEAQLRDLEAEVKRFCSPSPASTDVMERQPQRQESAPAAKECSKEPVAGPLPLSAETKAGLVATVIPKLSSLDKTTRLGACSADPPEPVSIADAPPVTRDADAKFLDSVCDVPAGFQAPQIWERPVTPRLGTVPHAPARSPAGVAPALSICPARAATESRASVSPIAAGDAAARVGSLSGGGLQRAQPAVSAGDMFYHQDPEVQAIINDIIRKEILDAQAKKVPYDEKKNILKGILFNINPDKVAEEEKGKHTEAQLFFKGWEKNHKDWFLGTPPSAAPSAPLYSS